MCRVRRGAKDILETIEKGGKQDGNDIEFQTERKKTCSYWRTLVQSQAYRDDSLYAWKEEY